MPQKPAMNPWTERLLTYLEQAPRPVEWLLGSTIGMVPPGRAWREREVLREAHYRKRGDPFVPDEPSDEKIRVGQRNIVRKSLGSLVRAGRIDIYIENGEEWARIARPRRVPTSEELSASARKGWETWRKSGRKKTYSPEARVKLSEKGRRVWANLSDEKKEAARRRLYEASLKHRGQKAPHDQK